MSHVSHRKILSHYALLGTAEVASRLLGLAATVLIVHRFGDEAFGRLSFSYNFVLYGIYLGVFGTDVYAVREVAARPELLGRIASTVIVLRLILAGLIYLGLLIVAQFAEASRSQVNLIAIYGLALFCGAFQLNWGAQAAQRFGALAAANFGVQAVYVLLLVAVVQMTQQLWVVPAVQTIAEVASAVGLLWWMSRAVARLEVPLPKREWLNILRASAPIGVARFLRMFALGSDLLLLGLLVPMNEVGWYGGSHKVFMLCTTLGALYYVILLPRLVQQNHVSRDAFRHELSSSLRMVLPAAIVGAAFLALMSPRILLLLYTPPFQAGSRALQILLAAWVIGMINAHYRNALFTLGRQMQDMQLVAVSSVVHVVLKLLLIPRLGLEGAAIGTLCGEAMLWILSWQMMRVSLRATHPIAAPPALPPQPVDSQSSFHDEA